MANYAISGQDKLLYSTSFDIFWSSNDNKSTFHTSTFKWLKKTADKSVVYIETC